MVNADLRCVMSSKRDGGNSAMRGPTLIGEDGKLSVVTVRSIS
jgi:hypothetical protein